MPFVHGKTAELHWLGSDWGIYYNQLELDQERDLHDVTCFGDQGHRFFPGLKDGSVTVNGFYEQSLMDAQLDTLLNTIFGNGSYLSPPGAASTFVFAPQGMTAGNRVVFGRVREAKFNYQSSATDMVKDTVEFKSDSYGFYSGFSAGPFFSTSGATASIDRGGAAPTANQRIAIGTQSNIVLGGANQGFIANVEHSPDNSSWSTLFQMAWGASDPGFAGIADYVTGVSYGDVKQRGDVGALVTVNRYIRLNMSTSPNLPINMQWNYVVF